jgi:hypothetical protein
MNPADTTAAAGGATVPGRPALDSGGLCVTGSLFVDCGEGRATSPGRFIYSRPPRARYECLLCLTAEGPVHGEADVKAFVQQIRTAHRTRCTAPQEHVRE